MQNQSELQNVAERFSIKGKIKNIERINKGYINRTYKVETLSEHNHIHQYILQRINTNVFPDIDVLMSNFKVTTEHLSTSLQMPGHHKRGMVQTLRPTKDGKLYFKDEDGAWRVITYFDNVYSLDIPDDANVFYHAGVSFGRFIKAMSSLEIGKIKERVFSINTENIIVTGLATQYKLEFAVSSVAVHVSGLEKDIASLNSDTLSGSIDVTNLPIGIHEVELILDLDEGKYGYLPVKVMVYITDASAPEVNAP